MITLTACRYNGAPTQGPSAQFDELGGTIGRADTNHLVLPDPERGISRVHARVVFRGVSGYAIVDSGSNPVSVNGQTLGNGCEHPLAPGDEVQIGAYVLKAGEVSASANASDDPFADLFGDAVVGLAQAPHEPVVQRSVTQTWVAQAAAPVPAQPTLRDGIPEDWDPFAEPSAAMAPAPSGPAPMGEAMAFDASGSDLFSAAPHSASLDDIFDLAGAPDGADPLGLMPGPLPAAEDRQGSELNTPMPRVSVASFDIVSRIPAPAAGGSPAQAGSSGLPQGAVLSWDASAAMAQAGPASPEIPLSPQAPARPAPARQSVAMADDGVDSAPTAGTAALLAALLQGLSAPGLKLEALTPATMLLLGELLREAMAGAVDLLRARAALKRELRAEQTMIVARENNPLKFSPSAQVALQHLLGPASPGFMAPVAAVRDAFDDLQAHQLAAMAGMKAALEGVLQRFDPAQLESQLASRSSGLAGLIPGTRKARLWELFQELFGQLDREAQDNFDELFGRAFVQAYEAQLDRLASERSRAVAADAANNKG